LGYTGLGEIIRLDDFVEIKTEGFNKGCELWRKSFRQNGEKRQICRGWI